MRTTALSARRSSRSSRWVALLLLSTVLPVASCSNGSTSYCDAVRDAEQEWSEAGASLQDPAAAARLVTTVRRIEASPPDEVRADWRKLLDLFERFTVDNPDLSSLTKQLAGLESAAKRVETHAKETCGVDLGR
ncbi:hypothetical protein [Terrabacter sp. MAHUQ-38]|uniref:hypothetical protein n=1 Tax=unclassified Terrabacter TaxID=2630222 RepID=UPI00165E24E0|nr:hypothetical protein [Terrabacter sp. MAHUQ-38]MBC9823241.1 hypothetical protein [Terrabacter sp. MAHUQ-38]